MKGARIQVREAQRNLRYHRLNFSRLHPEILDGRRAPLLSLSFKAADNLRKDAPSWRQILNERIEVRVMETFRNECKAKSKQLVVSAPKVFLFGQPHAQPQAQPHAIGRHKPTQADTPHMTW